VDRTPARSRNAAIDQDIITLAEGRLHRVAQNPYDR
jgi:hypothetical protein